MPTRPRRTKPHTPADVASHLAWFFHRNGYVRRYDPLRRKLLGAQSYKKGYEVRLVANSTEELERIGQLLREAGFRPGAPFGHAQQHRLPIYGREAVSRFLEIVGEPGKRRRRLKLK